MKKPQLSIFSPAFLELTSRRDEPHPCTTPEATWAGPWHVERRGAEYAVVRRGGEPEAVVSFEETALLLAAVFPALGRGPLYWLRGPEPGEADGRSVVLQSVLGERGVAPVGRLRHRCDELVPLLSAADSLLRSPWSFSLLLDAAPFETLFQAGAELAHRLEERQPETGGNP